MHLKPGSRDHPVERGKVFLAAGKDWDQLVGLLAVDIFKVGMGPHPVAKRRRQGLRLVILRGAEQFTVGLEHAVKTVRGFRKRIEQSLEIVEMKIDGEDTGRFIRSDRDATIDSAVTPTSPSTKR